MNNLQESSARNRLTELLDSQIILLDGPMGTMIQSYDLNEQDFRGERFKDWKHDLKGNNDLLNITKPEIIQNIHDEFIKVVQPSLKRIPLIQMLLQWLTMGWRIWYMS